METLKNFLSKSLTSYHAVANASAFLETHGFKRLSETEDWELSEGGKYYITRGGNGLIAFRIGGLDNYSYKIACAHVDSPAFKLKENPIEKKVGVATFNVERYGGGLLYTFFDRPLKLAGRVVKSENHKVYAETVESDYTLTIPSVAIHQNRNANESFAPNLQIDMQPLIATLGNAESWLEKFAGENVLSYDLYLVPTQEPYYYGVENEFFASPRIDDLSGAMAILEGIANGAESDGVSVCALFNAEEIGNRTISGAESNLLESTLKRISLSLRFDEAEHAKALASSFMLSVDNGHATHPNHPEKTDVTNKPVLGGGVLIKAHAEGAYATDGLSSAVVKTLFDKAGVRHQAFFNRSDVRSGATLSYTLTRLGINGADIGLPQLAMHSACETIAISDYEEMKNGLTAFYSSDFLAQEDGYVIK